MERILCLLVVILAVRVDTAAAVCEDDQSLDCGYLDRVLNICTQHADMDNVQKSCAKTCNLCSADVAWTAWNDWSGCDVTCGGGIQARTRQCDVTDPENELSCPGENNETNTCNDNPCPVDGGWSDWSDWGMCSVTCDSGFQSRERTCSNPYPNSSGQYCSGSPVEYRTCVTKLCQLSEGKACPRHFISYGQSCYIILPNVKLDWHEGQVFCSIFGDGEGKLVEIETSSENTFLINEIKKRRLIDDTVDGFWIGGNDIQKEKSWVWRKHNRPMSFTFWYPGEPNNFGDEEDCSALRMGYEYKWNDLACFGKRSLICEIQLK